jgi:hypothetical protein
MTLTIHDERLHGDWGASRHIERDIPSGDAVGQRNLRSARNQALVVAGLARQAGKAIKIDLGTGRVQVQMPGGELREGREPTRERAAGG